MRGREEARLLHDESIWEEGAKSIEFRNKPTLHAPDQPHLYQRIQVSTDSLGPPAHVRLGNSWTDGPHRCGWDNIPLGWHVYNQMPSRLLSFRIRHVSEPRMDVVRPRHLPDWLTDARAEYPMHVADILAEVGGEGVNPSIQSAPLGFKPNVTGERVNEPQPARPRTSEIRRFTLPSRMAALSSGVRSGTVSSVAIGSRSPMGNG